MRKYTGLSAIRILRKINYFKKGHFFIDGRSLKVDIEKEKAVVVTNKGVERYDLIDEKIIHKPVKQDLKSSAWDEFRK